jgi:hypothetical protein
MTVENKKLIIDAILDFVGNDLERAEETEILSQETDQQLISRLIKIAGYFQELYLVGTADLSNFK